jgi:hypothetical protein
MASKRPEFGELFVKVVCIIAPGSCSSSSSPPSDGLEKGQETMTDIRTKSGGPLRNRPASFSDELSRLGYNRRAAPGQLELLVDLDDWLA